MCPERAHSAFPDAEEDAHSAARTVATPQTESPSYRLAFQDPDFLVREELRPVRLQLELLKPELALKEQQIISTIVVFGSARIPAPEVAAKVLAAAEADLRDRPDDPLLQARVEQARRLVDRSRYYDAARRFSQLASEAGQRTPEKDFVIVTGGGPGIMEAANRGADDMGAESIGLNIVLPFEQAPNRYITPALSFQFHYFAIRKMHFLLRAAALACFPGGFGTMDELFEVLTLIQTRKITPIPVILFGEQWWRKIINFDAMVEEGVIAPEDVGIFQYVESAEEAWAAIRDFYR